MGSVGKSDNMNVPYDEWGEMKDGANIENIYDENGSVIGNIRDEYRSETEPYHESATKSQVLNEVDAWKNDDGTYGSGDEAIYIAYEDGKFLNLTDGDPHKRWSKKGISGISVSTADYQYVWGGEWNRSPYKAPEFHPYTTSEWDNDANTVEGYQNSFSGYRTTARWIERVKTTYVQNPRTGRYEPKRETIRKSTKRKLS